MVILGGEHIEFASSYLTLANSAYAIFPPILWKGNEIWSCHAHVSRYKTEVKTAKQKQRILGHKKKFNDVNEIENNSVLTVKPLEIIAVSNRTSRTFRASESSGLFLQATCICKLKFIRMEHPRGTWSKITELSQWINKLQIIKIQCNF